MADDPGLTDLETTILLLPQISRGVHLDGPLAAPLRHALHLIELWKIDSPADDPVPLTQAFRLLDDAKTVMRAILRAAAAEDYSSRSCYWDLPGAEVLLSELRAIVWQAMLAGTFVIEAIKGVRGNRYRTVLPAELPRLTADWGLSRLMLDGRDEFINVRVGRMPAEPVKKAWRAKPSLAELKLVIADIALGYPQAKERPETRPSFEEVWIKLRAHFEMKIPRDDVRKALDVAPHLKRGRGQHGKSKS